MAQYEREDIDGSKHFETWFVDCKHYKKGVPPEKLQGLIAWAHAERPHTALVVCSGFLSNPAKDWLSDYERNNLPPFRIKRWERPTLERLTSDKGDLLARWLLTGMRSESEILVAEQGYNDRIWYGRHAMFIEEYERVVAGEETKLARPPTPEIAKGALEAGTARRRVRRARQAAPRRRLRVGRILREVVGAPVGLWATSGTCSTRNRLARGPLSPR